MRLAVAVFAKTVGLSPLKTRLAKDIGKEKAEEFYRLSVAAIEQVLTEVNRSFPVLLPNWVVAEETAYSLPCWQSFPAMWTGDGVLGTRLANVSERLFETHDGVAFIGTDSPQLSLRTFSEVLDKLSEDPDVCVVGPATDGGFYLFVSLEPVPREIWEQVSYSESSTLSELLDLLRLNGREVKLLAAEQDVDVSEDLDRLQKHLSGRSDLLPAQQELLRWLDNR